MNDAEARLVYMAVQIARNFKVRGEEAAIAATADHIASFWSGRMRAMLMEIPADQIPDAAVREAVTRLKMAGAPKHVTGATAVQGGSDAG